jgi:hypothetical protein
LYCRAQNRYREKQKNKAAETEAEYDAAASELERLRLENDRLQVGGCAGPRQGGHLERCRGGLAVGAPAQPAGQRAS